MYEFSIPAAVCESLLFPIAYAKVNCETFGFLSIRYMKMAFQDVDDLFLCDNPRPQASLVAQTVKNLPAMQETWVQSLGWEDPLEKGMDTHSSILAWRIPWTWRSLAGYSLWDHKESDMTE